MDKNKETRMEPKAINDVLDQFVAGLRPGQQSGPGPVPTHISLNRTPGEFRALGKALLRAAGVVVPGEADAGRSTVIALPLVALADGVATAVVTVTLLDTAGVPVPGALVVLEPDHACLITTETPVSDAAGVVTFAVARVEHGKVVYTATDVTDGVRLSQTATVMFKDAIPQGA